MYIHTAKVIEINKKVLIKNVVYWLNDNLIT